MSADIMSADKKCSRHVFALLDDIHDDRKCLHDDRKCPQTFSVVRLSSKSSTTSSTCRRTARRHRSTTRRHPQRHKISADIFYRCGCRPTAQRQLEDVVEMFNDIHDDTKCLQTFPVVVAVVQQHDDVVELFDDVVEQLDDINDDMKKAPSSYWPTGPVNQRKFFDVVERQKMSFRPVWPLQDKSYCFAFSHFELECSTTSFVVGMSGFHRITMT